MTSADVITSGSTCLDTANARIDQFCDLLKRVLEYNPSKARMCDLSEAVSISTSPYLKDRDAESEAAQEHANSSSLPYA